MFKIKIYTTTRYPSWVEDNIPFITKMLNKVKNIDLAPIEIEKIDLKELPTFKNGKYTVPDWNWLKHNIFESGYNAVGLHLSLADRRKFGLSSNIRGKYHFQKDDVLDFYIVANKGEEAKGYDFDKLTQFFLHEICHGFDVWKHGFPNIDVHNWDYNLKRIHELPATYDLNDMPVLQRVNLLKWALRTIIGILLGKQKQSIAMIHPVEDYKTLITREYGVPNESYGLTGRHIGVDIATPYKTPVKACTDGRVTVSGYTKTLGNFCHFQYKKEGQLYTDRYLHLFDKPTVGGYKRGSIIGRTGNSGQSSNPHIHIDIWVDDIDLTIINRSNWDTVTVDPTKHYV